MDFASEERRGYWPQRCSSMLQYNLGSKGVPLCELIPMGNYALQITWSVVGCFMTAFGVFLQVKASFLTLPGEGAVKGKHCGMLRLLFPREETAP